MDFLSDFLSLTGVVHITWRMVVMWGVILVLFYLGVFRKFEPLLLVPIAFGALLDTVTIAPEDRLTAGAAVDDVMPGAGGM